MNDDLRVVFSHRPDPDLPPFGLWYGSGETLAPSPRGRHTADGGDTRTHMPDAASLVAQLVDGLDPGAMVTRFVVVAEVIDAAGERAIWVDTQDGATQWDTYGLLTFALQREKAWQIAQRLDDAEDDE